MMKFQNYIILLTALFFQLLACRPKTVNITERKGEKIDLIDTLMVYNPNDSSFLKLKDWLRPAHKRIVVSLDAAACFSCSDDLVIWKDIVDHAQNKDVKFLFYLHTTNFEKIRPFFRKWRFYHPIIIDKNNQFYTTNNMLPDKKFRAMILDAKNHLDYLGNPIYDQQSTSIYARLLQPK